VPRRIHATIFALLVLVTLIDRSVGLGAEPKKKIPPAPLPLFPAVQEWIATLDAPPSAGGAIDAERVYIPIQSEQLVALSRGSGATLWKREIESTWPPIVIADTVYLVASDEIHALDSATGAQKWRTAFDGRMTAPLTGVRYQVSGVRGGPGIGEQVSGNVLLGIFERGLVIAFSADDGRMLWTHDLGAASHFTPAIDGVRAVFALEDSRAVALRLADGRTDWEQKLEGMLTQPSFVHDRVFVGSNNNFLYALTNENGRLAWRWKSGGDVIGTSGDVKGGAYYASLDNVLRAVNRGNGNQRWIKEIPTRPVLPPQTFGDGMKYEEIVVLTGATSEIDAFAAKNGAVIGMYAPPADSSLEGAPLIDPLLKPYQVAMVVITRDGRVIGLTPSAMLLPEPANVPFSLELPGRRLERERITPAPR
jgi:outer membrane protein assembly factor BamB